MNKGALIQKSVVTFQCFILTYWWISSPYHLLLNRTVIYYEQSIKDFFTFNFQFPYISPIVSRSFLVMLILFCVLDSCGYSASVWGHWDIYTWSFWQAIFVVVRNYPDKWGKYHRINLLRTKCRLCIFSYPSIIISSKAAKK